MTEYNDINSGKGIKCDNEDIYCDSEDYYCDGSVVYNQVDGED